MAQVSVTLKMQVTIPVNDQVLFEEDRIGTIGKGRDAKLIVNGTRESVLQELHILRSNLLLAIEKVMENERG